MRYAAVVSGEPMVWWISESSIGMGGDEYVGGEEQRRWM